MARAPRLTPAGVQQSLHLADAIDTLFVVLRQRHPNTPLLPAAARLMNEFTRELATLAPDPIDVMDPPTA